MRQHHQTAARPDRLIGFLSVDPTQDGWERELRVGHEELGLRGIKLLPMYAGFSMDDARLDPLWKYAEQRGLPRDTPVHEVVDILEDAQILGKGARGPNPAGMSVLTFLPLTSLCR